MIVPGLSQVHAWLQRYSQRHRPLDKAEALRRVAQGEGQYVEFKATTGTLKAAIKTLAAFASQDGGGFVFLGIMNDGSPNKGFQIGSNTVEQVAQSIKRNTLSMVSAESLIPLIHVFEQPTLIVIQVPSSTHNGGPYLAYGQRWRRSGRSTQRVDLDYGQLARAYQQNLWDDESDEYLAFRFCAQCGSTRLSRSETIDHAHDRLYRFIKCEECGWRDWSE